MEAKLLFEPHNGYGARDPDGEPWPFGYISEDVGRPNPIFELTPLFERPREELLAYATLFAAAPDLLEALKECLGWHDFADDLHKPIEVRAAYMRARAALAKAEPSLSGEGK